MHLSGEIALPPNPEQMVRVLVGVPDFAAMIKISTQDRVLPVSDPVLFTAELNSGPRLLPLTLFQFLQSQLIPSLTQQRQLNNR